MKISAVVITRNEEKNISDLIDNLSGIDEIIIADGQSTDKTKEIAEQKGVKVILRNDKYDIPTEQDREEFAQKYGFDPAFTPETLVPNFGEYRNFALQHAKNDWVYMPDADERVEWKLDKIAKLDEFDQIKCKLNTFQICKLFRKSKSKWVGRQHEVVTSFSPVKVAYTDKMKITHIQDKSKPRYIKPNLEYGLLKEDDIRTHFYLGREYYYGKEYDKAIKIFDIYIKRATWLSELAEVYYFKALCLWETQRGNEAREACASALVINADMKKAHKLMADMSWEHNRKKWLRFAKLATNNDVVFP